MRGGDSATSATETNRISHKPASILRVVLPAFDHHPKRLKSSSAARRRSLSSESKLMNMNINDLPDIVLVEILCRLGYYEFVSKCKSVCKRWCNLMSDPYFMRRFLYCRLQSDQKQSQPMTLLTLISKKRKQFHTPTLSWSSSSLLLAPVFERLMSFHSLKEEPIVVATYNDLVLCCATKHFQRDYFICNPYTMQWVALPPLSRVLYHVPVGFICDSPLYYYYEKDKEEGVQQQLININVDYRCKVVRFLPYGDTKSNSQWFAMEKSSLKFKVEIFCFEIGEWRESVISSPRKFSFNEINSDINFAYNGMVYWSSRSKNANFLIGLDPFTINKDTTDDGDGDIDDYYKCRFIELIVPIDKEPINVPYPYYYIQCLGVRGGCLRMCCFDSFHNSLLVWELKEEDDLIIEANGATTLLAKRVGGDYPLAFAYRVKLIAFDPNDEDILYLRAPVNGYGISQVEDTGFMMKVNIRTRSLAYWPMKAKESKTDYCFFPLNVLPWWPTPVPRLPHRSAAFLMFGFLGVIVEKLTDLIDDMLCCSDR